MANFSKICALTLFLFFTLLAGSFAQQPIKVLNGKVKKILLDRHEFVVSYENPVSARLEELVVRADEHTGFGKGVHFEDFREGDPVSVDYQEEAGGIPRALQVKRVNLTGVPDEIKKVRL